MWKAFCASCLIFIVVSGCARTNVDDSTDESMSDGNSQHAAVAVGWDDLKLISQLSELRGGSEIHVLTAGHFKIKPNACWHEAEGPIQLGPWNMIIAALNQIAADHAVGTNDSCFPAGTSNDHFDGAGELKFSTGNTLQILDTRYESQGLSVCTKLRNVAAVQLLVQGLDQMLPTTPFAGSCVNH